MPAYIVVEVEVNDPERYENYKAMVPPSLEAYGGRFVVRGGACQTVEGEWKPTRLVVIEFPSLADAKRWYDSEEYRAPKAQRIRAGRTSMIMVEGVA